MRFLITGARAGLAKAFTRGPRAGAKYIKKVAYFSGGKMRWRYYYADGKKKEEGKAHHDPHEEHEHHVQSELTEHYPNLKGKIRRTIDITVSKLKELLGIKPTKMEVGDQFYSSQVKPYIEKEQAGEESERSPMERIARAFEMLPDYIKEEVDPEALKDLPSDPKGGFSGAKYPGLTKFRVLNSDEDSYAKGRPVAGYANPVDGELTIIGDHTFKPPVGQPRFRGPLTWAEEVVWHESGHHVHFAMERRPKDHPDRKAIEQWKKGLPGNKISDYAATAWYEDFAESFACAMSLPKELAEKCPERYEFMRKHVLTTLPEIGELLDTPDEELQWWVSKPNTPATKVLNHLHHREPASPFHSYYSENDQFYQVSKDGRTVYIRFGPSNKEEEDGWQRMPDTTYEETIEGPDGEPITLKLPKYENLLGPRFKKTESIKEVYDENGRPLTDRQAYWYLGQDDEDVIGNVPEAEEDFEKFVANEPKDTHLLSYKLYTSLGFAGDHTHGKELKRIEKVIEAQKKYDEIAKKKAAGKKLTKTEETKLEKPRPDFELYRHSWAPVEVDEHTFVQKTGTFKFGSVRPAPEQPFTARDPETGKVVTRYDEATGKDVPVLTARVYEQENPDGTFARLTVNESAPFATGDTIWVPGAHGEWKKTKLKKGDSLDPYQLARDYDTTAKELLDRNGRFDRGQITDPILAALINPHGKPIMDSTTLQQMMRDAALDRHVDEQTGRTVGRRAWVTLKGGPRPEDGLAHLQVEFDGAGPPRVVGDYWARKLGKDDVRIDELLNKQDEIDVPRIQERKPKKRPTTPGELAWFFDPKSEKRILGTIVRKTAKGYQMQPLPGQGKGVSKEAVTVARVQAMGEEEIPGSPGIRKRMVEPLEKDVLLYMDDVPKDSGANSPEGTIMIKLPKDGSYTPDEMKHMPGVRVLEPREGEMLMRVTISPEDIPRLRERMGGFVMDSRVKAKLQELDESTRRIAEEHGKKQIIEREQIEDKDGNVQPDGPLGRELVTGDDGIQPGEHRIRAVQKMAKNNGRLYAAHFMGTGKTALAIMAGAMMRNLEDPETGEPSARRSTKRTIHIVPLNTAENWHQEFTKFASPPTLIGASTLSNSVQLPKLPKRKERESDAQYKERVMTFWKEGLKENPNWWNPWEDNSNSVIIPFEYFRDNEEALRLLDQFDGMVIDESHKVARENLISKAVERWNPNMKSFLALSGTPITNTLDTLPRIVEIVTGGRTLLGSKEEFRERYLVPSNVLKAYGKKNAPLTDINPQKVGELAAILQPLMDVATTADVKGKSMPAVLLDENEPAHMTGQQARMYRAAMTALTPEEREALSASAAVGIDEEEMLSEEARRKVQVARSIANSPSYKAPDEREDATYETVEYSKDRRGRLIGKNVTKVFELPSVKKMTTPRKKGGWGGKWPTTSDIEKGVVDDGYLGALRVYMDRVLGVAYESLEGKEIDKSLLAKIKKGDMETLTGEPWGPDGGKLKNPDYGPEGMMARGVLDEETGAISPQKASYFDSTTGEWNEVEVPVGTRFIRDPRSKAQGVYYYENDWDFTGRFSDTGEGKQEPGGSDEGEGDDEGKAKKKKGQQSPKEGLEGYTVQRHPARRRERAMFDTVTVTNNAKCDKLEQTMRNTFKSDTGEGSDAQMIIFGNRIGSSCRTVESKLRTMGYMDVNEALGMPEWSADEDKKRAMGTRKFFVSYLGKSATLGDRDINSEVFRRQQDEFGKDTGTSMFVWRTMYGTTKNRMLKVGEMAEPWSRAHRKRISQNFVDGNGKAKKDGTPAGLEVPMRVMGVETDDGRVTQHYVYESDVPGKVRKQVKDIETLMRSQRGEAKDQSHEKIKELLKPYATNRRPLTDTQIDIYNNCQVMVASDAANVGLNWPCGSLVMYDSLFSPMEEWQRITRAARMLPPAVRGQAKPLIDKIGAYIEEQEAKNDFKEYEGVDSAMMLVREAMENALSKGERDELNDLPGGAPDQIVEAWFAKRAFDKIASLRESVGNQLRTKGHVPDPTKPPGSGNFVPPEAVTEADVMNEILTRHLTSFDREILKTRRYMVDVKRLTTSVDMPEFHVVKVEGPDGKTKKKKVPTGEYVTESPTEAEKAQLAQGRAKMVPYEFFLKLVQSAQPMHTRYDYISSWRGSLGAFSRLPGEDKQKAPATEAAKAMFYVPLQKAQIQVQP